jgi:hypothetical protein
MEQEHMIIIALLVVALYFLMNRKSCDCVKPCQGFNIEKFEPPYLPNARIETAPEDLVNRPSPISWIRNRREVDDYRGLHNVQSRNHNMYHSQYVRHHLKADHRGKMMRNMMGTESPQASPQDSAGSSAN